MGQGFQTFTHNVGNGLQTFGQFFGQRPNGASASISPNSVAIVQTTQPLNGEQPQVEVGQPISPQTAAQKKYFILVPIRAATGIQNHLPYHMPLKNNLPLDMDVGVFP